CLPSLKGRRLRRLKARRAGLCGGPKNPPAASLRPRSVCRITPPPISASSSRRRRPSPTRAAKTDRSPTICSRIGRSRSRSAPGELAGLIADLEERLPPPKKNEKTTGELQADLRSPAANQLRLDSSSPMRTRTEPEASAPIIPRNDTEDSRPKVGARDPTRAF